MDLNENMKLLDKYIVNDLVVVKYLDKCIVNDLVVANLAILGQIPLEIVKNTETHVI